MTMWRIKSNECVAPFHGVTIAPPLCFHVAFSIMMDLTRADCVAEALTLCNLAQTIDIITVSTYRRPNAEVFIV